MVSFICASRKAHQAGQEGGLFCDCLRCRAGMHTMAARATGKVREATDYQIGRRPRLGLWIACQNAHQFGSEISVVIGGVSRSSA